MATSQVEVGGLAERMVVLCPRAPLSSQQPRRDMTTTSSDVTRRELLSVAAVTGGAVLGGQLMPGAASAAAAQGGAAPAPRDFVLRPSGLRSTMIKRLEGRDEPILDRGLRIIDGHRHL